VLLGLVAVVFLIATARGQYVTQTVGNAGTINWSQLTIRVTGIGAPNPNMPEAAQRAGALTAARLDAGRKFLETIKGMNLTSETTVRNAMVENDVIVSRVEGVVKGMRQAGEPRYMSTGDVEVDFEVPITGNLADALLPEQMGGLQPLGRPLCPTCGQPWPAGKPVPPGVTLIQPGGVTPTGAPGGVYTGLIINAKGLGVMPAMAPKVVDEAGNEVYGSRYVSRQWAVQIGMVGYDKDLNRARNNDRVTANPLVINAVKVSGPNKADVVISSADAATIQAAAANQNFLDKCRVMFIVD